MNDEMERIWKEATNEYYGNLNQDSRCLDRNSNRGLPRMILEGYRYLRRFGMIF
jgi:hypothetical protein